MINQMIALTQRFARARQISLSVQKPVVQVQIRSNCIQFQMALFCAVEYCTKAMLPDGRIDISLEKEPDASLVTLHCHGKFRSENKLGDASSISGWEVLIRTMRSLGGTTDINPSKDRLLLSLADK